MSSDPSRVCVYGAFSGTRRFSTISISVRTDESQHSFTHMLAEVCWINKCARPILYFLSSGIFSISSVILWTPRDFGLIFTTVWNHTVGPLAAILVCDVMMRGYEAIWTKDQLDKTIFQTTENPNVSSSFSWQPTGKRPCFDLWEKKSLQTSLIFCRWHIVDNFPGDCISGCRNRWMEHWFGGKFIPSWFWTRCLFVGQFFPFVVLFRLERQ